MSSMQWGNFFLIFIVLSLIIVVKCCEPAEEGSRHVMSAFVSPQDSSKVFVWKRNSNVVAQCLANKPCESSFSQLYNTSQSFVNTGHYNISLTIINVTVGLPVFAASRWTLVSMTTPETTYFSCDLQVIAPVVKPNCSFIQVSTGFNVFCFAWRVYPPAACHLEIFVNKKPHVIISNVTTTSSRWSTTEPVYYNTSCSVHVPSSNLRPGLQELHMSIYPNVTSSIQDKKYGQTVFIFSIEIPDISSGSPSTFTCSCFKTDTSDNETTTQWYKNNSIIQPRTETNVATLGASNSYDHTQLKKIIYILVAILSAVIVVFIVTTICLATHIVKANRCTRMFRDRKNKNNRRADPQRYVDVEDSHISSGSRHSYLTIMGGESAVHYHIEGGVSQPGTSYYSNVNDTDHGTATSPRAAGNFEEDYVTPTDIYSEVV